MGHGRRGTAFRRAGVPANRGAIRWLWLAALAAGPGFPTSAATLAVPLQARVVWAHGDRVYLAPADSDSLRPGDLLTFAERGKRVAVGEVSSLYGGELAVARLSSGSLERVKKLERVQIVAERAPVRALASLRLGFPSGRRPCLWFFCDRMTLRPPLTVGAFRVDTLTDHVFRMVRGWADAPAPWPETLLVRLFDESADEEIALERGELDVAMFWPGELSTHVRDHPRWGIPAYGIRTRGVVAAMWYGPGGLPPDTGAVRLAELPLIGSLNEALFRGDLVPWREAAGALATSLAPSSPWSVERVSFEVDESCPGRRALERFLDRGRRPTAAGTEVVRVLYLDATRDDRDSLSQGIRDRTRTGRWSEQSIARRDSTEREAWRAGVAHEPPGYERTHLGPGGRLNVDFLFAIRCPLVCSPELRPYVTALGTAALADMLSCGP